MKRHGQRVERLDGKARVMVAAVEGKDFSFPELVGSAVVVSREMVESGLFTTCPMFQFRDFARKTRQGEESFTRDIPQVTAEDIQNLDKEGIVLDRAKISRGDILIGKVTPSNPKNFALEERLLRVIFGSRSETEKDVSLRYPFRDKGEVIGHFHVPSDDILTIGGVVVEVAIRRNLQIGDVLKDSRGNQLLVASVVEEGRMPGIQNKGYPDILIHPNSPLTALLHQKSYLQRPGRPTVIKWDYFTFEKTTVQVEDKINARSIGNYSLFYGTPIASDEASPVVKVKKETVITLAKKGYYENLREMLSVKAGANGALEVYEALIKGQSVSRFSSPPLTTARLEILLRGLCFSPKLDDNSFSLTLTTPKEILGWSKGEVKKAETMDYRSGEPERGGLFCQRIFGPIRDWECACGKHQWPKDKGKICDRCGVEIVESRVRRERFGHIKLAQPVIHPFCPSVILEYLPVIPPDWRPMVRIENGQWASSDLNEAYQRIINRNNRLEHLYSVRAPMVMIQNEHRLLEKAIDSLFRGWTTERRFVGLIGEFSNLVEDLFEKKVDYTGRGIVIPDTHLSEGAIGLPEKMVAELYQPMLFAQVMKNKASTLRAAKNHLEKMLLSSEGRDLLESVLANRPLLTITNENHLGTFQPVLVEGEVIRLHPKSAAKLNLRFDGEKVTVHLPLSQSAITELKTQPSVSLETFSILEGLNEEKLKDWALEKKSLSLGAFDQLILGMGHN